MERLVIQGGHRVSGTLRPSGNKNEALPCLAASLLTDEPVVLHELPKIRDVQVMVDLLVDLGASAEWLGPNSLRISGQRGVKSALDPQLCTRIRASILLAGPLLGRLGQVQLPFPGGDVIGRRRIDTHFTAFKSMGARVAMEQDHYYLSHSLPLQPADVFFDEPSVTATENAIMAAALARGTVILRHVAMEPHVQGLCRMLQAMGAHIDGVGMPTLTIEGVDRLSGCEHTVGPDYLEVGSFAGLAAVTGGRLDIRPVRADDLRMLRVVLRRLGVDTELSEDTLTVPADQDLWVRPDYHGHIPTIYDAPWPGFPTDLMSVAIAVATQCSGTVLFFEKMFEGRMFFVDHLIRMGARIILCDPHRVVVVGPSPLYGTRLESPDIRAGMALLLATCAARGESVIYNVGQIDRGYERVDEKLRSVGARIERVQEL